MLITGGAGFIGSQFVRDLLGDGYPEFADVEVTVLDKLTYAGNPANLAAIADDPRYRFIRGDITDPATLSMALPGIGIVVNFAAESHADVFLRGNFLGVQMLLDAARAAGVTTFLQVSTDEVYGSIDTGAWPETAAVRPSSPYAAAKAGADLLCRSYHRTYGMDVRITRCSNNYGPYQYPEKIIPRFVTNLLDGKPVPLYGDGAHVRDWLHVADHCAGIRLVLTHGVPGEIYHIGGGTELSSRDLTGLLLDACGSDWSMVRQVADPPGHDHRYAVDTTKIRALGYEPRVGFAAGLAGTVAWYLDHQDWWRALAQPAR
jgi:dTDP-glucose 4,6-dehydratase